MSRQRIGKDGNAAQRQASHLVTVVGPVETQHRGGTDIQQDAGGDDGQGSKVDWRPKIDDRQGGDRDGLRDDSAALEGAEGLHTEREGHPIEAIVPEAQEIDPERKALLAWNNRQDRHSDAPESHDR